MANCGPWIYKWCKKKKKEKVLWLKKVEKHWFIWTVTLPALPEPPTRNYIQTLQGVVFFCFFYLNRYTDKRLKIDAVYLRDHRGRHTTLNRATPEPQVSAHPWLKTTFPVTDNPVRLPPAGRERETLARRRLSPTTPSHDRTCAVNARAASLIIGSFRRWPPWAVN